MALLGIDVGTTASKAIVFSDEGKQLGYAYQEYPPFENTYETHGDLLWENMCKVISTAVEKAGEQAKEIKALAISSFGESFVPIDKDGNVLMNTALYMSSCGTEQSKWLEEHIGNDRIMKVTGAKIHPMYSLPKMMNIREEQPEIYREIYQFLPISVFCSYKLCGECKVDYSLAARTMAFDVLNKCWDTELLRLAGIDENKLPQPIATGAKVGTVLPEVARSLGLPQGVIVAAGGHDQVCAAIGAGVLSTDVAIDGTGTVECITSVFEKPQLEESFLNNNFVCVPYPVKGMYTTYAFNFTGGAILKWYKDTLGRYEQQVAKEQGISVYRYLDMQGAKEPTGIIVIPHFSGSATPDMNEYAKGAFLGITMDTDAPTLYRALIEGVTYEMMYNLEKLEEFGIFMSVLRAVGGGSKSSYWLQMKADILGKTIVPLDLDEAGIAGTAMLSGVCCGVYPSLEEAEKLFVKKKQPYEPNPERHQVYLKQYQKFKTIRQLIADVFK